MSKKSRFSSELAVFWGKKLVASQEHHVFIWCWGNFSLIIFFQWACYVFCVDFLLILFWRTLYAYFTLENGWKYRHFPVISLFLKNLLDVLLAMTWLNCIHTHPLSILLKNLLRLLFVMSWLTCILHNKHHTLSSDCIFKKSLLHLLICIDLAHLNFHMYIIHFHLILLFKRTCYVCYACKNFEHSQAKQCEQDEDYCLVGIFRLL